MLRQIIRKTITGRSKLFGIGFNEANNITKEYKPDKPFLKILTKINGKRKTVIRNDNQFSKKNKPIASNVDNIITKMFEFLMNFNCII